MGTARLDAPKDGPTGRIVQIDAYRAYALFGLFFVHCVELFELHWYDPQSTPLFELAFLIFGGKAFAMFALSFGISFSIIMQRAALRGEAYELRFLWRLFILLLIGVLHTLIYRGDILVVLALFGVLLLPMNKIKNHVVLIGIGLIFILNLPGLWRVISAYQGGLTAFDIMGNYDAPAMAAYMSGDFVATVIANATSGNLVKWLFMAESGRLAQIVGLFLVGLALGRTGFFSDLDKHRKTRLILIATTTLLTIGLYALRPSILSWFPPVEGWQAPLVGSLWVDGWTAMAFMFAQTFVFFELWYLLKGRGLELIAAAGRMSLTLYVGQSVIFIPILYNFGLGLFDDVTMVQMTLTAILGFAAQCVFAAYWLKHFNYGPLEWLWRVATKLSWDVPLVRRDGVVG